MAHRSSYLIGILITIVLGMFLSWWLCCNVAAAAEISEAEEDIQTAVNPLVLTEADGTFNYSTNDNFNFRDSDYNIVRPLSDSVRIGVDLLKSHLEANPEKFINITGYATSEEVNNSPFPSLGMARATHVKNYLISRGVPASQINYQGASAESLMKEDSIFIGPVAFEFSESAEYDDSELEAMAVRIKEEPLIVYFEYGASSIKVTPEQQQKVADIAKYVHLNDQASFHIIGHTDKTSSSEFNYELGEKRAGFVKEYFISHGIPADRITTESKGETEPIADNSTEEGRAKNRRTVITIN